MRRRALVGIAACAALLLTLLAPVALASELNDVIAPKTTTSALREYRELMTSTWRYYFTAPAPGPKACTTATAGRQRVSVVTNFHSGQSSCTIPANRQIYINEYTHQCSTMPGDHDGFGVAPSDVRDCTYTISRVLISVWLDGRNIGNSFGRTFWLGTPAFSATLASGRFPQASERQVTAAAWGWSLLLRRLPKGMHTVRCRVLWGTAANPRRLKTQSIIRLRVR